jgi:hypothetical protein
MRNLNLLNSNNDKHKSIRIKTEIGDKFLNVNLDQTYESLDILSVKVFQKDVYRLFDSDYGIIVGRVNARQLGIPNCRISVFVPIDEDTVTNPLTLEDIKKIETAAIYPYETVYDEDAQGKIYNLLPKYSKNRNFNGYPNNVYGIGATPKSPVGTFPEKEEILVNETLAYVYDKYYKYTTITNESGDYILTVPANRTYTVNMSCDITDIGKYSTTPAMLKLRGLSSNFFTPDGSKMNVDLPLESLPNIDIQNKTITVKPLWSQNTDNTNVGINRLDFELVIGDKVEPITTIIGNYFTMDEFAWWNYQYDISASDFNNPLLSAILNLLNINASRQVNADGEEDDGNGNDIKISTQVKGNIDIKVFNIKKNVTEGDAEELNKETTPYNSPIYSKYDFNKDIELVDPNKYIISKNNGSFYIIIRCNRNKVITDEIGNLISVDDDNVNGVFTSFRGYFYAINDERVDNPNTKDYAYIAGGGTDVTGKIRLKIPQLVGYQPAIKDKWIWQHYKFDFGEIYGVAQLNSVRSPGLSATDEESFNQTNILYFGNGSIGAGQSANTPRPNANSIDNGGKYTNFYNHIKCIECLNQGTVHFAMKNQWINFSIFFTNFKYNITDIDQPTLYYVDEYITYKFYLEDNNEPIGGGQTNNKWVASEYNKTNFVKINKEDLINNFYEYKIGGIEQLGFRIPKADLKGEYLRATNPGGNVMNQDAGEGVSQYYFLKGANTNDMIRYLIESNII